MKEERKKKMGKRYLSAEETLPERLRKKLVENTSWYKEKNNEDNCFEAFHPKIVDMLALI